MPDSPNKTSQPAQPTQVTALIHVHTTASDGAGTHQEVAQAAARAGVEVLILTDHDKLSPGAGWQGPVLVISGQEITPRYNHRLAISPPDQKKKRPWTVLAHPLDSSMEFLEDSRSFPALDFSRLKDGGLEIWNALSAFKRNLGKSWQALARIVMPRTFLAGPDPLTLALWDTMGRRHRWPGVGGGDAHAFGKQRSWLPLKVYSYARHMGLITTGLWLERPFSGEYDQDAALVLGALGQGRCYAALGPARGFSCMVRGGKSRNLWPGSEQPFEPGMELKVSLPARGRVRIIKNGRTISEGKGRDFIQPLDGPGVWRAEARRFRPPAGWRPWIFCNPFYLR